jgi:hypothetical protein
MPGFPCSRFAFTLYPVAFLLFTGFLFVEVLHLILFSLHYIDHLHISCIYIPVLVRIPMASF